METRYRKQQYLQVEDKITFIDLGRLGGKAIQCSADGGGPDLKCTEVRGSGLLLYFNLCFIMYVLEIVIIALIHIAY